MLGQTGRARSPQVWYCVAPRDRTRLEAMAAALFPELGRQCPAFLRHKDLLFSPRLLRAHHIDYVQARPQLAHHAKGQLNVAQGLGRLRAELYVKFQQQFALTPTVGPKCSTAHEP